MLGTFETKYSEAIITLIIVLLDSYKLIYADAIYNLFTISYTKKIVALIVIRTIHGILRK